MAPRLDDRYVWLGFAAFFTLAFYGLRYTIKYTPSSPRRDSIASPSDGGDRNERPEDSITLATLRTLATSTNLNIAKAAKDIIIQRFISSPESHEMLKRDAASVDVNLRRQSGIALRFLYELYDDADPEFDADDRTDYDGNDDPGFLGDDATAVRRTLMRLNGASSRRGNHGAGTASTMSSTDSLPDLFEVLETEDEIMVEQDDVIRGWSRVPRPVSAGRSMNSDEMRRRRREATVMYDGIDEADPQNEVEERLVRMLQEHGG
ncbi:hypothetical protein LTR62_004236 [Meristemomyces frigidus]|uniref:Uncharacterized protein n=1 Tax=Meristemomyces frigidus TaxID=1508187 RepID=A0AAN7TR36_9PEZI|nr:hypothetical protein LTR62_004236 [Meristemomyces frigidus]